LYLALSSLHLNFAPCSDSNETLALAFLPLVLIFDFGFLVIFAVGAAVSRVKLLREVARL
jgi:hypothetical protein